MEPTIYYRSNINCYPPIPQPFYAYGTGISQLGRNQSRGTKGNVNPFVELLCGLEGIGEIVLYEQVFQIRPGDVFYYLPGENHMLRSICDNWSVRWICFDGPLADAVMLSYRYARHQHLKTSYPEHLLDELEHGIGDNAPLQVRRMAAIILELLAYTGGSNGSGMHSEVLTQHCVELIVANLADPQLSVGMLCDELKVARSTLTQTFAEQMGCPPGRYILDHRMAHAVALLRGTTLPISEVAKRCGFAEARSFSRFIRRGNHMSPLELRKQGGSSKTLPPNLDGSRTNPPEK